MATPEPELNFHIPEAEPSGSWKWILLGVIVVVAVIGTLVWVGIRSRPQGGGTLATAPYAPSLPIGDIKLSEAQNFVGGKVTYVTGNIANTGTQTVAGITMEVVFRNSLGQVVQREVQHPLVLHSVGITTDYVPLDQAPLLPNAKDEFRLTFEHVSADWNQGYPELRIVDVNFAK